MTGDIRSVFLPDAEFAARFGRARFRASLRRPRNVIQIVVNTALALAVLVAGIILALPALAIFGAVLLVVMGVIWPRRIRARLIAATERLYREGSRFETVFRSDAVTIRTDVTSNEISYDAIGGTTCFHGDLYVRIQKTGQWVVLPAELAPPAAIDRMRAALAAR